MQKIEFRFEELPTKGKMEAIYTTAGQVRSKTSFVCC